MTHEALIYVLEIAVAQITQHNADPLHYTSPLSLWPISETLQRLRAGEKVDPPIKE